MGYCHAETDAFLLKSVSGTSLARLMSGYPAAPRSNYSHAEFKPSLVRSRSKDFAYKIAVAEQRLQLGQTPSYIQRNLEDQFGASVTPSEMPRSRCGAGYVSTGYCITQGISSIRDSSLLTCLV